MDKLGYKLQKLTRRKTGYPIATVAYYGPDNQFASKVVVAILHSEKEKEATELRKWFAGALDVRMDITITREMIEYIEALNVHRVAMPENIIGCPHEEGIDYPDGESCPLCPFWKDRDRWTGELIR